MKVLGRTAVPGGDKAISHRALIISGISRGPSVIYGLNEGSDCCCTARCLAELGVSIRKKKAAAGMWGGRGFDLEKTEDVLFLQ